VSKESPIAPKSDKHHGASYLFKNLLSLVLWPSIAHDPYFGTANASFHPSLNISTPSPICWPNQQSPQEGGGATLGKYIILNPDRVNLLRWPQPKPYRSSVPEFLHLRISIEVRALVRQPHFVMFEALMLVMASFPRVSGGLVASLTSGGCGAAIMG
jgi:hypothetical protein